MLQYDYKLILIENPLCGQSVAISLRIGRFTSVRKSRCPVIFGMPEYIKVLPGGPPFDTALAGKRRPESKSLQKCTTSVHDTRDLDKNQSIWARSQAMIAEFQHCAGPPKTDFWSRAPVKENCRWLNPWLFLIDKIERKNCHTDSSTSQKTDNIQGRLLRYYIRSWISWTGQWIPWAYVGKRKYAI